MGSAPAMSAAARAEAPAIAMNAAAMAVSRMSSDRIAAAIRHANTGPSAAISGGPAGTMCRKIRPGRFPPRQPVGDRGRQAESGADDQHGRQEPRTGDQADDGEECRRPPDRSRPGAGAQVSHAAPPASAAAPTDPATAPPPSTATSAPRAAPPARSGPAGVDLQAPKVDAGESAPSRRAPGTLTQRQGSSPSCPDHAASSISSAPLP